MSAERRVKLFRNGRNQAVRIPREFEPPGSDAVMRKAGDRLVIERASPGGPNARLLAAPASLVPLNAPDDFPEIAESPPEIFDL